MIQRFVPPRGRSGMYASQLHGADSDVQEVSVVAAEEEPEEMYEHAEQAWQPEWTEQPEWPEQQPEMMATAAEIDEIFDDEEPAPSKSRSHKIALWSSVVMVGVVLGLVIVGVMKFVTGPVEVKADKKVATAAKPIATPKTGTSLFQGQNFTFSYPSQFDQISNKSTAVPFLEQYMLGSNSNYRHSISVELIKVSSGEGIDGHSGYKGRLVKSEEYHEAREKINGETVAVLSRNDKQEQTLFWGHKDKVLAIAVTSTDTHDDVAAILNNIKTSVRWRQ